MFHSPAALTIVTLVSGALLTGAPATAGGETCGGRPATIVGTGTVTRGTPGDDVIVTGDSRITYADAGDDLICVTPSRSPYGDLFVDAGPGDDVVDASTSTTPVNITQLGTGLDRYLGGPSPDEVRANGADDRVEAADAMTLEVTEPVTGPVGNYSGAPLALIRVWSADQDVELDLDGNIIVAGRLAADVAGFSAASVAAPSVILRGNTKDNFLRASGCDLRIIGNGGDDLLEGFGGEGAPRFECNRVATMRGGQGNDEIKGTLGRNRLIGNAGNDELQGRPYADVLLGGSGRDGLEGGAGPDVLRGNAGNDHLNGDPGRDRLLGNRGRDAADGNDGSDRCVAERERRCER